MVGESTRSSSMTANDETRRTLLVVEDNEIARVGLATILDREGYIVVTVEHGRAALDRLQGGFVPDLILLDMMLPVVDGWDFLKQRKQDPALAAVPVVITTALGVASPEWATAMGATGLIRKPLNTGPLLTEIRRCLTR